MKRILALLYLLLAVTLPAQAVTVEGVRLWADAEHSRLIFDADAPIQHSVFGLAQPERLVIDIRNATLKAKLPGAGDDRYVQGLRSSARNGKDLRVVLELRQSVRPKTYILTPTSEHGHRLVVELHDADKAAGPRGASALASAGEAVAPAAAAAKPVVPVAAARSAAAQGESGRDIVVAIDAGHGGVDVGAVGRSGTYEKDVVLAIARKLKALVAAEPGMRAVMTRDSDQFIPLRKRMEIARQQKADIFISIHADAFTNSRVQGASVFTISDRGASSEAARRLAERENASDLVGGVKLDDKDNILASVLLDLSQTGTRQASVEIAEQVFRQFKSIGKVHYPRPQQAGFVVLKAPDVPSLLVETAYISNPEEERKLKDARQQERMAAAILAGVRNYFQKSPPPGTLLAARQQSPRRHVIGRGETLSTIAQQYRVSLNSLRDSNKLGHDEVRVGQVLEIPES